MIPEVPMLQDFQVPHLHSGLNWSRARPIHKFSTSLFLQIAIIPYDSGTFTPVTLSQILNSSSCFPTSFATLLGLASFFPGFQ